MVVSAQILVPAPIWEGKPSLGSRGAALQRGIFRVSVAGTEPGLEQLKISQTSVQHLHIRRLLQGVLVPAGAQKIGEIFVLATGLSWELPSAAQLRCPHRGKQSRQRIPGAELNKAPVSIENISYIKIIPTPWLSPSAALLTNHAQLSSKTGGKSPVQLSKSVKSHHPHCLFCTFRNTEFIWIY